MKALNSQSIDITLPSIEGLQDNSSANKGMVSGSTIRPSVVPFPELSTQRLRLREITAVDARGIYAIHGDPAVMRWFGNDPLPDVEAAQRLIEFFANCRRSATGIRWGIERTEDQTLIGTCGFYLWDRNLQRSNIGYELSTSAWGRGYMQEALEAIIPWGFAEMHLNRIEAHIHSDNLASIKMAGIFGFVEEGLLRELEFWGGRHHDMLLFSLLQREYKGRIKKAMKERGPLSRLVALFRKPGGRHK